jgi:pimeloyl-ACP methyl ester carboxylesterase
MIVFQLSAPSPTAKSEPCYTNHSASMPPVFDKFFGRSIDLANFLDSSISRDGKKTKERKLVRLRSKQMLKMAAGWCTEEFREMAKMTAHKRCLFGLLLLLVAAPSAKAMDWKRVGEAAWNGINWDAANDILDNLSWKFYRHPLAMQERSWGLFLPGKIDPSRPLVILVHGMDGDQGSCLDMQKLLEGQRLQTATFSYPGEERLSRSSHRLGENLQALRETFPGLKVDLVTQSMGGLIARDYIEGDEYAGGVDRLIMVCPPNGGSEWAKLAPVSKVAVNEWRWRHDPEWNVAWMIGEGLCEAGWDLNPDSGFLCELNQRERRAGVKYTIVAGNEPVGDRVAADVLDVAGNALPVAMDETWPSKSLRQAALIWAGELRMKIGKSDGPVSLASAGLAGVSDVVVLHADHVALFESVDGREPAAWLVVMNRLGNSGAN